MQELHQKYNKSVTTLRKYFDKTELPTHVPKASGKPVNLVLDATFFGRTDGILVFRANRQNIFWCPIVSENMKVIAESLVKLDSYGYTFQGFVIDGRKGVIQLLEGLYPGVPIQLCHFHQTQIVRRYTTNRPKTECGRKLKELMRMLRSSSREAFTIAFYSLQIEYAEFLKERNEHGQFVHKRLRSAFRSLKSNLPYLFAYLDHSQLDLPNTTNTCDGSFAHWKQKVKIHRGLRKTRRNKMIDFLLQKS